jgi:predicted metal-dependent phosphoesterase TrpH/PAS domain-containing protein
MPTLIRVDLHCHSSFSDGALTPVQVAEKLAAAGVQYAALTDHDTVAGLPAFRQALTRHGIGFVTGVEFTTLHDNRELHLLAYGFDPEHPELQRTLAEIAAASSSASAQFASHHRPTTAATIELIHRAGGIAIIAHPSQTESDPRRLRALLDGLRKLGLDGVEALYGPVSPALRAELVELATESGLVVSAGSDCHSDAGQAPGIDVPATLWKAFRDAAFDSAARAASPEPRVSPPLPVEQRVHWRSFLFHIVMPAGLALILFIVALFTVLLPYFEQTLLDRKRETIRELTQAAWSVLAEAAHAEQIGQLTREQAQTLAKNRIEAMRYGREGKDYFWLQDLEPRMVMHPYRSDLNGKNVSEFRDARGTRIFVAFADLVRRKGEGYVSYVWQWKDDPQRMEPKESYIRLFPPWDWIIGTGIYVHDVQAEIARLRMHLVNVSLAIVGVVLVLLSYIVRQGLRLETSRSDAERRLRESTERYRALTEAATEGALFVSAGRCRYANPVMLELVGCSGAQLELLDIDDLFPAVEANNAWREHLATPHAGESPVTVPGVLQRRDRTRLGCMLTLRRVLDGPMTGYMVLVRHSTESAEVPGARAVLNRLLQLPTTVAADLTSEITQASRVEEISTLCRRTPDLVRALLENGASTSLIARVLAMVTDAATQRLIALTIDEIGPAPVAYAFLALGSQGRQSQSLYTDQDNALVYDLVEGADAAAAEAYFLALANRVCSGLDQAGYRECPGRSMASNPHWRQPLNVWKRYFEDWIRRPEPHEVMEFGMVFDFRAVAGEHSLARELRSHVGLVLQSTPGFFPQAAQNALQFKAPRRLFGTIMTAGGKEHAGLFDLKAATMPIIGFARLYALQHGIQDTSTLERLEALTRLGVLLDSQRREILAAYEALLRLRLWNQSMAIERDQQPDNWLDPGRLGHIEEAVLRECFDEIDALQTRIQRDFLGGE